MVMRNCLRTINARPKTETRTSHDHRIPVQFGCTFTFWESQHRHAEQQVKADESSANKQDGKHVRKNRAGTSYSWLWKRARFALVWTGRRVAEANPDYPAHISNNNATVLMLLCTSHWNAHFCNTVWGNMWVFLVHANSLPLLYSCQLASVRILTVLK